MCQLLLGTEGCLSIDHYFDHYLFHVCKYQMNYGIIHLKSSLYGSARRQKKENMNGDFPPCRQTGSAGDVD